MKKTLIIASLLALGMIPAIASEPQVSVAPPARPEIAKPDNGFRQPPENDAFEKRLKLTEKQKVQAKEIRMRGHEQMRPVMEQIKSKHQEAAAVKKSKLAPQAQQEKLDKIGGELRALQKQAHELRMQNMKEFESILTKKQKKELEKMKQEGRKKFEQEHRRPPMFGPDFKPKFERENGFPPHPPIDDKE